MLYNIPNKQVALNRGNNIYINEVMRQSFYVILR
jgi:hypothetical protein